MALKDNSPTLSYINWKDLIITHGEDAYQIQNSHTNMKYVYWDITNPYILQCFNRTQTQSTGMYQLFINDNGMATERSHDDLIISWDGNNADLIASQIFGLHESNKETGNKFVAIETDINGIKQTVGNTQTEMDKLTESVSQIKQQADNIDLSVKSLEQEFSDDKQVTELREKLNKSMIDFNSSLGVFKSDIYTCYKDNKIDSEEKIKINTHLDILDNKKSEVLKHVDVVIVMMQEEGQTTQKNKLTNAKTKFIDSVSNLRTYITTAISDNTIVPSEITGITDMFAKCSVAINEMKNICDECIFLGAGGKITEELARIGIKSDEIILSVSKTEETIKNNLSIEKNLFQGNVTDFNNAISYLVKVLSDVWKDGSVSTEERSILNAAMSNVDTEKGDIESKYNSLYNNTNISSSQKTVLKATYDKFNAKYSDMKASIQGAVSDEFFNDAEKLQVNTAINEVLSEITQLHPIMTQSMDDIQLNTNRKEIENAKNELQGNINDVIGRVDDLGIYIDGTFENNVLDEAERTLISANLKDLEMQKIDVDNQYNQLILSQYLDGVLKTQFQDKYNLLTSKYNNLVKVMNDILAKQELINNSDRDNLNNAKDQFNLAIGEFSRIINEVIEYIGRKQSESAVGDFSKQLEDLNTKVDNIMDDVGGAVADGIIDETERIAIKQNLKILETDFAESESEYLKVYNNPNLVGEIKTQLNVSFNAYRSKYQNLVLVINNLLNKVGNIDDVDRAKLDVAYVEYRDSIKVYLSKLYDAIDSITNKGINDAKAEINKEIGDLNTSLGNLENTMNNAFKDGVLSDAEKLAMKQHLQTIATEKADIDKQYASLYGNADLIGSSKTNLKTSYDDYNSKYNSLVSVINNILNKVGLVDSTDQTNLNNAFTNYRAASGVYSQRINEAIDSIAKVKADKAESESKRFTETQIKIVNDLIELRATKTEVTDAKNEAINSSNASTDSKLQNYPTVTEMEGAIKVSSENINLSVSKTYSTKNETTNAKNEAINSSKEFTQSQINIVNNNINLKVNKDDLLSEINIKSNGIDINSDDVNIRGVFSTYNRNNPTARYMQVADGFWHLYKNSSVTKPSMSAGYWGQRGTVPYISIGRDNAWETSSSGMLYMTSNEDDYSEDYRLEYARLSRDGQNSIMRSNLHFRTDGSVGYNSFFDNKTLQNIYSHNFDGGISTVSDIRCSDIRVNNLVGRNVAVGIWGQGNYGGVSMDSSIGYFMPLYDNMLSCGHPGFRWSTIHLMNSPTITSDARCKENIKYTSNSTNETTYDDMYEFAKNIELAQYDYKCKDEDRVGLEHGLGFIAQDLVNDKVGELIINKDVGEYLSYNLTTYVSVLAGALKKSIEKIEILENEINTLKASK